MGVIGRHDLRDPPVLPLDREHWLEGLLPKGRRRASDETAPESRAEISPEERAVLLVGILDDPTAREDEKYDTATDLEYFSGPLVESGLIRIIRAEDFTSVLAQQ
ncbi:hypothetical protein ACFVTC_18460 [Streptomyces sp. NPDC057950]|uniref:hypothetical protein n=1 Tax=Streptomyces sp. NPDC057950 TaxID=3346288 RepID=UPI0036E59CA0